MTESVEEDERILFLCGGMDERWIDMLRDEIRLARAAAYNQGIEDARQVASAFIGEEKAKAREWRGSKPTLSNLAMKRAVAYRALRDAIASLKKPTNEDASG